MSTNRQILALALAAVATTSCTDRRHPAQLPVAPLDVPSDAVSAYVTVSNATPSVGSPVTVSVHARRGAQMGVIGSFTLRLTYDAIALKFKEAARSTHGMVLTNATNPGVLVAAGASAEGFTDDELLSATFTVNSPDALKSLVLTVNELNSVKFEDQKTKMRVERALFRDARVQK